LQLLAGLYPLEEGGEVLPQIGHGDAGHAGHFILYKLIVQVAGRRLPGAVTWGEEDGAEAVREPPRSRRRSRPAN
jgi:hypothetical protein